MPSKEAMELAEKAMPGHCNASWKCANCSCKKCKDSRSELAAGIDVAIAEAVRAHSHDSCPCRNGAPCRENCTCQTSVSSAGCLHCTGYGSHNQKMKQAGMIAAAIRNRKDESDE